jgi:hypothetical protein
MNFNNIIPIGDHCIIAQILKQLNIRKKAYPFDWNCYKDMTDTNIYININIINELLKKNDNFDDIRFITKKMLNNPDLIFPHDDISNSDVVQKFIRRMERLHNDIVDNSKNLYILCTRFIIIPEEEVLNFYKTIIKYNPESKILLISGIDHPYFINLKNENIIFKYLMNYDPKNFYAFDYSHFRPEFSKYINSLNLTINIQ